MRRNVNCDAAYGVFPKYEDAKGRVFDRIDQAGPTTLRDEAVQAWRDGTFSAATQLVEELRPRRLIPSNARTLGSPLGALDYAIKELAGDDREVHCLLSGGIDSCAIVESLHRDGFRVFGHALLDEALDEGELQRARALCRKLSIPLEEHVIAEAELPDFFAEAVRAAERPIFNARGVSLALFMKKLGLRRAFSGIGADEALDSARAETVKTVFQPKTLPPTVWAARHFGLELLLPYLHGTFIGITVPTPNKELFRHAMVQRLGADICFAPKSPRMARSVFRGPARARWLELLGPPADNDYDEPALTDASFDILRRHFANAPWPESSS